MCVCTTMNMAIIQVKPCVISMDYHDVEECIHTHAAPAILSATSRPCTISPKTVNPNSHPLSPVLSKCGLSPRLTKNSPAPLFGSSQRAMVTVPRLFGRLNSRGGLFRPVARGLPAASLKPPCKTKLGSALRPSHYLMVFHATPADAACQRTHLVYSDTPVKDAAGVLSGTDQRPDEGRVHRRCVFAQADLAG